MGNRYRFKLSDMMPNAWFYKLKDMNRASTAASHPGNVAKNNSSLPSSMKTTSLPPDVCPRKSYYFPRDLSPVLPEPPRRSSKQARPSRKSKPKPADPSPPMKQVSFSSTSLSYRASTDSVWTRTEDADSPDSIFDSSSPELRLDRVLTPESLGRRGSRVDPRVIDDPDIVIDMDENSFIRKPERAMGNRNINSVPNIELPRIITKPKHNYSANHVEIEEETKKSARKVRENGSRQVASRRRSVMSSSPRPRLKIKSPRLASKRLAQARRTSTSTATSGSPSVARRNLSGSLAVVKSSFDPQRDFRESMVEMIVEHNIKATKDLEELLACYLSLNSDEYHELIIQVFKQIWFDLTDINSLKV